MATTARPGKGIEIATNGHAGSNGADGAGANGNYVPNQVLATGDYAVIGTRPVRHDGVDKVTGRAIYGADTKLPGMLYGRVLRSPHAHARIVRLDTTRARALTGVKAIVTANDLPAVPDLEVNLGEGGGNLRFLQDNILAGERALYRGHAIAAVAATSQHVADEALKLIDVDYEVLPAVVDVREAMKDSAPLIHPDLRTESLGEQTDKASNVSTHSRFEIGDLEAGFKQADVVVEREFTTSMVHQGYIELTNATAVWNADDTITIWTSTQGAFAVREQVADILQHPVSRIRVFPQEIGGGFGGKINVYLEPVAALLSQKAGRPVKLIMTRAEVLQATGPAPGTWLRVKMGATRDGRLTAAEAEMAMESGAYPGSDTGAAAQCIFACYEIPNGRIDGYDVVVNRPKTAPYRAPGAPQAAFACESVVDELCQQLGMDPIEFRLKNSVKEGSRTVDGRSYPRIGAIEVLEAARNHPHYQTPLTGPNRARGVAHGYWFNIGLESSVNISVNPDGTVNLVEGSTDIGGTRSSIAMQAAEVLGIGAYDVRPAVVDTNSVGYTGVTGGSRTTFATGYAAVLAAREVAEKMKARAALLWEGDVADVTFEKGVFSSKDGHKQMTFKELAGKLSETGGLITGTGSIDPPAPGGAFATNIVDVEVDPETGKVRVLRFTVVQDAGKAIHPSYVEGQMQGGSVQGIGWALNEEYFMNDRGQMANASLLDYRLPTAFDLPMIDTVIVEVPNPGHPYGVRGVGEVPIVPPPAAVANAVSRATGVRMTRLPMSPRVVLEETGQI